jgi:hypothetical protein
VRSSLARLLAVSTLAVVGTSCSRTLDTTGLQTTLTQQLEAQLGAKHLSVSCPSGLKVHAGGTFQCTVSVPSSATLTVDVTQTDDKGNVTYKIVGLSVPSGSPTPSK